MQDYIKVACATPKVAIAAPFKNAKAALQLATQHTDCEIVVFPELSITGYTCADLFAQSYLIQQAMEATLWLAEQLPQQGFAGMAVVGLPVQADNQLFNCAAFFTRWKNFGIGSKAVFAQL